MLKLLRCVVRFIWFVGLLLAAIVDAKLRAQMSAPEGAVWVHRWCRRIVRAMGLRCTITGTPPTAGPLAVVSNHLSYLDVLMYSASAPFIMVSKIEVRSWPLIGWITAQAGTIYVERADAPGGQKQTHAEVNAAMAEAFRSSLPVLFFPEGTTTDGEGVVDFRRGLFHSVLQDRVPMRAAAVRYTFDEPNQDATIGENVCYWGDMEFAPHIFQFLGLRGVHTHVRYGEENIQGSDRFTLAANTHEAVSDLYDELAATAPQTSPARHEEEPAILHGFRSWPKSWSRSWGSPR